MKFFKLLSWILLISLSACSRESSTAVVTSNDESVVTDAPDLSGI